MCYQPDDSVNQKAENDGNQNEDEQRQEGNLPREDEFPGVQETIYRLKTHSLENEPEERDDNCDD